MSLPWPDLTAAQWRARLSAARPYVQKLRAIVDGTVDLDFDEAQHPRDDHGRFTAGGGADVLARPSSAYPTRQRTGADTQRRYSDGHGHYTPERAALHAAIVAKYLRGKTPVDHPVATILGGGPASGKSSLVEAAHLGAINTVHVNTDDIRTDFPEYREGVGTNPHIAAETHEEASEVAKQLLGTALSGHYHVLLDGTGDSSIEKLGGKVAAMRAAGHRVVGEYVSLPTDQAVAQMQARGAATGRYVPETFLRATHAAIARTFPEAIRQGLFDRVSLHDTAIQHHPRLVASAVRSTLTIHAPALWQTFLAKGDEHGH